jgi:transposase
MAPIEDTPAGDDGSSAASVNAAIEALRAENALLRAENAALTARLAELERRLGLNSSNSGKPPSSDGLKKPVRVSSLRGSSGKKSGGQKGHRGETLCRVETPDATIEHYPEACTACGEVLTAAMATGHVARQVFDLPEPRPLIVTEHRAYGCRCAACGAQTRAAFPEAVSAPVQYGKRIGALVVYLLHYQLLPEKRLAALMADLFGVKLATATIGRISQGCASRLRGFADTVRDHVAAAPVKHMDETGFRIGGKTQWLHIASTIWLTFYRTSAKRGSLLANVTGIVVHDHWKPYYTMTGVLHALCNAHHLRELQALVEIEKEDWARKMQRLLRRACHLTNLAREQNLPLKPGLIALIERIYDGILANGLAFHDAQPALTKAGRRGRTPRRVGHNLRWTRKTGQVAKRDSRP